jgi:DNA-binding SARP family transcriptional activator
MMVALATLKRWHDQWPEAEALSLEAGQLAEQHGLAVEACLAHANVWLARAYLGEPSQAREHLTAIVSTLRTKNARTELQQVLTISAIVALLDSRPSTARRHLREALRVAESIGTAQTLAVEAIHMPVLKTLIDEPNLLSRDLAYLRTAQARQAYLIRPAKASQRLPYTLRVLSLGQETLARDGKGVPASDWRAVTARELFFYLLFVGPSRRETICAEFWPDSTTEQVRSNFHTTLYHARQALGADALTFEEGLYRINVAVEVWCDAYQLEHLVVQARLLAPRDARAEDLCRKAVELYHGDFLPRLDADWIVTYREKIRELYLEALVRLGQSVRSRRDLSAALDIFKRASAVDPYREDIHQAILTCYAEKGQRQKVRAHLRDLERLLQKDLDSEPSLETRALAAALLQ